jgi:hypothetical protein
MNFNEAIKHITGEKLHLYRAHKWMKLYIAETIANKTFLEYWYNNEGDLDQWAVDFYRDFFGRWKREYKSRKAKQSRSKRGKVKRKVEGEGVGPEIVGVTGCG